MLSWFITFHISMNLTFSLFAGNSLLVSMFSCVKSLQNTLVLHLEQHILPTLSQSYAYPVRIYTLIGRAGTSEKKLSSIGRHCDLQRWFSSDSSIFQQKKALLLAHGSGALNNLSRTYCETWWDDRKPANLRKGMENLWTIFPTVAWDEGSE